MQKFEQYNISDAACQFALAALEQVDEAVVPDGNASKVFFSDESATSIKGRLWANVFKFALDLDKYYDAYCALVSNPDDENRFICLRRFIIVLYERGATKVGSPTVVCLSSVRKLFIKNYCFYTLTSPS